MGQKGRQPLGNTATHICQYLWVGRGALSPPPRKYDGGWGYTCISQGRSSPALLYFVGLNPGKFQLLGWGGARRARFCAGGKSTWQGRTEMAEPVFVRGGLGSTITMHRAAVEMAEINLNYLCCLGSWTARFCFDLVSLLKYFSNRAVP